MSPSQAKAGEVVLVQAGDAHCNPRYGENALVQVTLTDATGSIVMTETAPMTDAGGFTFRFEVPTQAAPGEASVKAVPYALDWCDDTGRNNRAAHPTATVTRTSCAARMKPLTILP
ncbi:hypothetical protein GCM10007170_36780 [Arthrobacter liuii]|uniref:Uncharacterized protein n=1 Tax=Arthrobacter liuii TaxID=1476996 RepID=A0ABQ2AWN7_9MICC|nr:hypothetical protein GCM10007170_36780 [Arthrobacter liuii]